MRVSAGKTAAEREAHTQARHGWLRQRRWEVETFGHEDKGLKKGRLRRWVARPELKVPKYPRKICLQKGIWGLAVLKY